MCKSLGLVCALQRAQRKEPSSGSDGPCMLSRFSFKLLLAAPHFLFKGCPWFLKGI